MFINAEPPFTGCNLSPLLFSIFIADLCQELKRSGIGIPIGCLIICCILFADDLVLIARSKKQLELLVNITIRYFETHRLKISETKSKILDSKEQDGESIFIIDDSDTITLDHVISFKYLGVPLNSMPRRFFSDYNEQVKRRAQAYLGRVMSLSKSGPDRAELAHALWTQVAIPSILYGCEVCPLTETTIEEVEKCQNTVGKFMLQLPRSSANVAVNLDAGLKPIWAVVAQRVLSYAQKTMMKPYDSWVKIAMTENIRNGSTNWYTRYLSKWKNKTGTFDCGLSQIEKNVKHAAILDVLHRQRREAKTSTFAMNSPSLGRRDSWFKPKNWLNDSGMSKIYAEFRSSNAGLGNRGPARNGQHYKLCPLCAKHGLKALNNEVGTWLF